MTPCPPFARRALRFCLTLLAAPLLAAGDLPAAGPLDPGQLAIWNDPGFQKRFADSYIAETDIEPRVTVVEREQMQKVLVLMAANKVDEALRLLDKVRGPATTAVYDFTVANLHFQREELELAAQAYQVAVDKHTKFRRAWRNLALIHVRQGDFDKAISAFTRVLELGGGDALTYGLTGFAYSSVENFLAAETAYRQAILLDPKTLDWQMGLARSLFRQQRHAEAVALCGALIAQYPERGDLWLLQANAYIGLGQPLRAAENYELVDRLGQATADSLYMLGDIYVNEELYDLAVNAYLRALSMRPDSAPARLLRAAKVLSSRGAVDDCRRLLDQLDQLGADNMEPDQQKEMLKLRARLAVADGAGEEEVAVLRRIVALDPLDGEALILLGQHSHRNDDLEQAVFYYERAAALDAFEADAKVRHAQLLVGQGNYREALPLLRRAQELKPRADVQKYFDQIERLAKGR